MFWHNIKLILDQHNYPDNAAGIKTNFL